MNGEILAVFEGFEAIDDDVFWGIHILGHLGVIEQAVATEPGDVPVDSRGRDVQVSCNLSIRHAAGDLVEDLGVKDKASVRISHGKNSRL